MRRRVSPPAPQRRPAATMAPIALSRDTRSDAVGDQLFGVVQDVGPQAHTQAHLEPRDGGDVWPGVAMEDVRDRGVVDAGAVAHLPQAQLATRLTQREGDAPGDLGGDVVAGDLRPVGDQLARSRALGGHTPSVGPRAPIGCPEATTQNASSRLTASECRNIPVSTCGVGVPHRCGRPGPPISVNEAVDSFHPSLPAERWEVISAFVRDATRDAGFEGVPAARHVMTVLAKYVDWSHLVCGIELDRAKIFKESRIIEFTETQLSHLQPSTAGNYRSRLMAIAAALAPQSPRSRMRSLPPSSGIAPYGADEVEGLWRWARSQSSSADRRDATILLAGCLGAGLTAREVGDLKQRDVLCDANHVVLRVSGVRPRYVPVLTELAHHFRDLTDPASPDVYLFRPGRCTNPKNHVSNFVMRRSPVGITPSTQRARVTWFIGRMRAGVPIKALMTAMGVEDFSAIARYLQYVPDLSDAEYRRALAGTGPQE